MVLLLNQEYLGAGEGSANESEVLMWAVCYAETFFLLLYIPLGLAGCHE